MHSCNQWNQIDLQVTYSVLQFVAMETKGRVCHAPYRVHISLLADLSDLLFRSTPLKHCGVFMCNVVLLNANHCCITKGQKDVSHGDILSTLLWVIGNFVLISVMKIKWLCVMRKEHIKLLCEVRLVWESETQLMDQRGFWSVGYENKAYVFCVMLLIIDSTYHSSLHLFHFFFPLGQALAQKARAGKLLPEEYQGGSFR